MKIIKYWPIGACLVVVSGLSMAGKALAKKLWVIKSEVDIIENKGENIVNSNNDRLRAVLINLSEQEACELLNKENKQAFVAERDGETFFCTALFDENRAKLTIRADKVVGVTFG